MVPASQCPSERAPIEPTNFSEELGPQFPTPYVSRSLTNAQPVVVGDVVPEPALPVSRSLLIATLPLPADFPAKEFDSAELHFRARTGTSVITPAQTWLEFAGAWTAVAYRLIDVAASPTSSFVSRSEIRIRHRHYRSVTPKRVSFSHFFIAGLAAIESFSYGVSAIAWEAGADDFALDSPDAKNGVSPQLTVERLQRNFPDDALTVSLSEITASMEYLRWVDQRPSWRSLSTGVRWWIVLPRSNQIDLAH